MSRANHPISAILGDRQQTSLSTAESIVVSWFTPDSTVVYGRLDCLDVFAGRFDERSQRRLRVPNRGGKTVVQARTVAVARDSAFERLCAHGISRNEAARRAGISSGHLSQIVNGLRGPSPGVLKRLHGVLFHGTRSEARVVPAEVKVLGWRKGGRRGIVVRGAGGPGGESIRAGGRIP